MAVGALSRIETDELVQSREDLSQLVQRLSMIARLHERERQHAYAAPDASRVSMAAAWQEASKLLTDAVDVAADLEARLSRQLRLACSVIRASQSAGQQAP